MNNLKIFAAAGLPLDNPDIRIYRQSYIPAHSELTWILGCFTTFGEMRRMTQFKEKAYRTQSEDDIKASIGVFNYPVLMAADILLYNAKYVPVGDDQTQHLEFTRDIAEKMNKQFGDLFTVPEPVPKQHEFFGKDQGLRVRDLIDPTKKMSKSDNSGKGVIFLNDDPEEAVKKIMSATTDSLTHLPANEEERKEQPGVANLMLIKALLTSSMNLPEGNTPGYAYLKQQVATDVKAFLTDFQKKLAKVDEDELMQKLKEDEKALAEAANQTLLKVQKAVGLRP